MNLADFDSAMRAAEHALGQRHASPEAAGRLARDVLASDITDDVRIVALWALGLACRELNDLPSAEDHLRAAVKLAEAGGDVWRAASVGSGLVSVLVARGHPVEGLSLASEIRDALPDGDRAELDMKCALALQEMGKLEESLTLSSRALEIIRCEGDPLVEARLRCNRGIVLALMGEMRAALDDQLIAERIAREHDQPLLGGGAAHNAGYVHGRMGNIVESLEAFARADRMYATLGNPGRYHGVLAADRCQVLLVAGLNDEARSSAELAVDALGDVDDVIDLAEAQLLLARACLAQGDHAAAHTAASTAEANFRSSGRTGWAALAGYLVISAEHAAGDGGTAVARLRDAAAIADELELFGWTAEAVAVRVSAAQMALDLDRRRDAEDHLRHAASARHHGSADQRANAWLATALLRRSRGDRGGTRRALTAGLDMVAQHQASLGATDLRVGAASHAEGLATVGITLAIEDRRPSEVLRWAERLRATALSIPPASAPDDGALATALSDLRRIRADLDTARSHGTATQQHEIELVRHERAVRNAARLVPGAETTAGVLDVRRLRAELDGQTLIEFVRHGDQLAAINVTAARCRLYELGSIDIARPSLESALFALRRLARTNGSQASRAAALESLRDALEQLDVALIAPLDLRASSVVIVPTGALHGVPWGGLPTLSGRDVTITPSASRWLNSPVTELGGRTAAVIAGPGLEHADREAEIVAMRYDGARILTGERATTERALAALEGSDIAHIACHGQLRADSPMFSSLRMHDGLVTVYDLERLTSPPKIVVLPACNAGAATVTTGDELIGTTSALLGIGVQTVIAPITEVNDAAIVWLMDSLHQQLGKGSTPARALADVRRLAVATADATNIGTALTLLCSS